MKSLVLCLCFFSTLAKAEILIIEQGRSQLIDRVGVSEILVANSEIAEIRPINQAVALLRAKAVGQTELYFMQSGQVIVSGVQVLEPGTALGGLQLHLIVLETQNNQGQGGGLDLGIQLNGQSTNDRSSVTASGLLNWIPTAEQSGLRVLARPRVRMAPHEPIELEVGGEIARAGADGATEDKVYGLQVAAQYHWVGAEIEVSHHIQLRTPSGEDAFRRQGLKQTVRVDLGEVTEFARFDGNDRSNRKKTSGFSFGRKDDTQSTGHWRVLGWFEPLGAY